VRSANSAFGSRCSPYLQDERVGVRDLDPWFTLPLARSETPR
jgi:hypothetical protein